MNCASLSPISTACYPGILKHRCSSLDAHGEKANLIAKENTLSIHTCKRVLKDDGIPQEEWESRIQEVNSKLKLSGKGLISERCEHTFSKTESDNIRIHTSSLGNLGFRPIFSPNE